MTPAGVAEPKRVMDPVGERMLRKMGWAGGGLGKDGQGRTAPLAASGQRGTAGAGTATGAFDAWWDRLYDSTAAKYTAAKRPEAPCDTSCDAAQDQACDAKATRVAGDSRKRKMRKRRERDVRRPRLD